MTPSTDQPLLSVRNLVVEFRPRGSSRDSFRRPLSRPSRLFRAVNGVSFDLQPSEVLGLVGESGCGKSTLTRCVLGILPAASGEIRFQGEPVTGHLGRYGRSIQTVFQDPMTSLNPRMRVRDIVEEPLRIHRLGDAASRRLRVEELLQAVALTPANFLERKPNELSAGQRQRVAIARALATDPNLLIADEPTSSLDASLQVQILEMLRLLQQQKGFAMLLVTHDLAAARRYCRRVAVMLRGQIVEIGPVEKIFGSPQHAYTVELVSQLVGVHAEVQRRGEGEEPAGGRD